MKNFKVGDRVSLTYDGWRFLTAHYTSEFTIDVYYTIIETLGKDFTGVIIMNSVDLKARCGIEYLTHIDYMDVI